VTCGLGDVARILKEEYGFHSYYGAELEFRDGVATGYRTSLVGIEHKTVIASELCGQLGVPPECTFGIGDSMSDKSLFGSVGTSIAVNYDEHLQGHADHYIEKTDTLYKVVPIILKAMHKLRS